MKINLHGVEFTIKKQPPKNTSLIPEKVWVSAVISCYLAKKYNFTDEELYDFCNPNKVPKEQLDYSVNKIKQAIPAKIVIT